MREILFRGKRIDDDEWFEGGVLREKDYVAITTTCPDYHGWLEFVEVIPETIGQFTGLTDKNGKKIFEGGYYQSRQRNAIVYFRREVWQVFAPDVLQDVGYVLF